MSDAGLTVGRNSDDVPMVAYVGQTRSPALIAQLERHGIGEVVVCGELPPRRRGFLHDPGAYREWRSGRPFNVCRWQRDMRWMSYRGIVPDFVVVPDIVAGGLASLAWSAFWRDSVPAEFPAYLAVQDGMAVADVLPHLPRYAGLFVGGSLRWKLATGAIWAELARRHGLGCHVGRVGTAARVHWARSIGATSIDSALPLRARAPGCVSRRGQHRRLRCNAGVSPRAARVRYRLIAAGLRSGDRGRPLGIHSGAAFAAVIGRWSSSRR